jgi:hypothetical protein
MLNKGSSHVLRSWKAALTAELFEVGDCVGGDDDGGGGGEDDNDGGAFDLGDGCVGAAVALGIYIIKPTQANKSWL